MQLNTKSWSNRYFPDGIEDSPEELQHKKEVRRMLEERLEQKKLKEELQDDFDLDKK